MSGGVIIPTIGRDEIVQIIKDKISYFKLGEGGFVLSGVTTEVIDAGSVGGTKVVDYVVTGGDFDIIDVNQGTKKFTIDEEVASYFPVGTQIKIEGSTGNDGSYTVVAAAEVGGDTEIEVSEAIPDPTIDGLLYVSHLPIAKGGATDLRHYPLIVEELTNPGLVLIQSVSDTTGTGSLTGNGVGTVNYKSGALHVVFTSDITVGSIVRTRFKYHDVRRDASTGLSLLDLESSGSAILPDGGRELYTVKKLFNVDVDTVVVFRGAGFGTIRCKMKLQLWEGIDDGRAATFGGIPYYFEGGVYDLNDVLLAYFTFDKQRKTGSTELAHTVDFVV